MKREILMLMAFAALAGSLPAAAQSTNEPPAYAKRFKDDKEMKSFAVGMSWGLRLKGILKNQEIDLDIDTAIKAFKESLTGATMPITEEEDTQILNLVMQEANARKAEKRKVLAETNKKAGDEFLAKNKTEPGVVTTQSGLQYKVLTPGPVVMPPTPTDVVTIKYRGTFLDGTEFDNSTKTGGTAEFRLDHPIPGLPLEALSHMTPGAHWRVFVPSKQAFGELGYGNLVGPNQTLIYDLEMMSFRPGSPQPPMTSDIIKVPSAEEMKKGAQIETIKASDLEKERLKEARTNK